MRISLDIDRCAHIDKQQGLSDANMYMETHALDTRFLHLVIRGNKISVGAGLPTPSLDKHLSGHFALAYRCVSRGEIGVA